MLPPPTPSFWGLAFFHIAKGRCLAIQTLPVKWSEGSAFSSPNSISQRSLLLIIWFSPPDFTNILEVFVCFTKAGCSMYYLNSPFLMTTSHSTLFHDYHLSIPVLMALGSFQFFTFTNCNAYLLSECLYPFMLVLLNRFLDKELLEIRIFASFPVLIDSAKFPTLFPNLITASSDGGDSLHLSSLCVRNPWFPPLWKARLGTVSGVRTSKPHIGVSYWRVRAWALDQSLSPASDLLFYMRTSPLTLQGCRERWNNPLRHSGKH